MTDQTDTDHVVYVSSTLDDNGKAAVLMQWGTLQTVLTPEVTLTTARDLMAAAAAAESDIALIRTGREVLKLNDAMIGRLMRDVRLRRPKPQGKTALRIEAVAGMKTGLPYVNIGRGSMKRQMDPDTAREMASHWTQTAVAAHIDVRLRYALGEWDRLNVVEIEDLFTLLRDSGR
ncbi:hypothetical protein ACGFZS_47165 [Streptomyces sp. NPDC048288]|uniref:hypothetical protein n=1 Tax=Streptomyces sp. NPDC048288 TaxID=3365529 RepID=UPI0037244988